MEATLQNDNPFQPTQPARPQFLTVLCILSFIMCGLSFIGAIWGVVADTPERMQQKTEEVRAMSPEAAEHMEEIQAEKENNPYLQISNYLNLFYALLSFMGVLMMWKLNKKGFFIYVIAELLPYIGFLIAWKPMMMLMSANGMMPNLGVIIFAIMLVFDIVFFILYAVNLKHMK